MEQATRQRTVLLVEDNQVLQKLFAIFLQKAGYAVLAASTGPEALDLVANHAGPIDLVLADLRLPGMNGVEMARKIQEVRPAVQTIYCSGDEIGAFTKGLRPTECVLRKPVRDEVLLGLVRKLLTS